MSPIVHRLRVDVTISLAQAIILAPGLAAIAIVDRVRRKSDAMLVVARRA